jgi:hypothetical protein
MERFVTSSNIFSCCDQDDFRNFRLVIGNCRNTQVNLTLILDLKLAVYIHIIKKTQEGFSIPVSVLSVSVNDNNGTDMLRRSDRCSSSGTVSN